MPTPKIRIDHLLVQLGLAPSRERAQALVMAGQVYVGDRRIEKSSQSFQAQDPIRVKGPDHPYVGRGGVKLAKALEDFGFDPADWVCLDVGASTGGFTDCLLQRGAKRVYAFDSGTHQLHDRLRTDPRVISKENFNVRHLGPADLPEPIDLAVFDVSFISLKLVLPPVLKATSGPLAVVLLVKPQFEAGKDQVGKGGIVRDEALRLAIVEDLAGFAAASGLEILGKSPAAIPGDKGNQEYFLAARRQK
ncbi:MAG TPA: TlyA family RNA methyltransferase [bacterium]|nr:TlyA family RNA methyltransferase [bacterium]